MPHKRIGLVGVGLVGSALMERFVFHGWEVIGFDIVAERLGPLSALTARAAPNADQVFDVADIVVISLPTSEIVAGVLDAVAPHLAGKTVVDTTTGDPEQMAGIAHRLAACGARYLDATIAGSSVQIRDGEAVVLVGGPAETVADCETLLRSFAAEVYHVGDWGAGARMKLVVNLVLGLNRAALAEGLAFARAVGFDPQTALDILRTGPAFSRVMDVKGEKMLTGDFTPHARLSQHHKDVRLILDMGRRLAARLPLSTVHEQLLEELEQQGCGDLDNSAILKAFQPETDVRGEG
ncbi:MAG: NAD(P)-dependent oxidoreductase [Planctomyces sp.]|nr:NAD(P)-dependent oxidoreductase [Planctomyces sp.]